jgi:hypothetical protein
MRIFFLVGMIAIVTSCSNSGSAVGKQLSGCDSLVINFTVPQSEAVIKSVTTTEEKAIKKLTRFVDGKEAAEFKCGYNGYLLFYFTGKLISNVSFNYADDGCKHFILTANEKLVTTTMSNEAADFLKSLEEGKNWY